jgi:secondary thiamine-phosphate synthase enzyme
VLKSTSEATGLKIRTHTLSYLTERGPQFIDITDNIVQLVQQSGIENGFVVVFSKHTTAAITINESEPHLICDMEQMLERILPPHHDYAHNTYAHVLGDGERPNGHSHCQHLLFGASENIPLVGGDLTFGQWQRVFLVELDHARERQVVVQIVGE